MGKMVVAESLRDKLKYNLMINHDSIEVSDKIFGFSTPAQKEFNAFFREKAFKLAVKHNVDVKLLKFSSCFFVYLDEKIFYF
ncbi:hypothetical protein SAMN04487770_11783 [Butyrivibrio sp. ob235]|uniref:hypothetical protein n=1 Tax=Butyrivibrio sp. ob235 TaxID=1761780 RepID=UPI0008D866FC|nr:hypothetical protein [Butyrivibrio sp. ob235]SEL79186.1 hypothetical protein SAMN04487770_11783 [Butyrivibrio sp. ob235]